MKKAWRVILTIAFIIILLGAIAIGVGYLTGADLEQVYTTLAESELGLFIDRLFGYWNTGYAYAQQWLAELAAMF